MVHSFILFFSVGTILGSISCTDPDNDPVAYYVHKSSSLAVDALSGEVKLVRKLDREVRTCHGQVKCDTEFIILNFEDWMYAHAYFACIRMIMCAR